jgi:hypothetical protein
MNAAEQAVIGAFDKRTTLPAYEVRAAAEQLESVKAVATALRSLERKNVILPDQYGLYTLYRDQIPVADATHPELEPLIEEYDDEEEIYA